jgi:hypothetical protein
MSGTPFPLACREASQQEGRSVGCHGLIAIRDALLPLTHTSVCLPICRRPRLAPRCYGPAPPMPLRYCSVDWKARSAPIRALSTSPIPDPHRHEDSVYRAVTTPRCGTGGTEGLMAAVDREKLGSPHQLLRGLPSPPAPHAAGDILPALIKIAACARQVTSVRVTRHHHLPVDRLGFGLSMDRGLRAKERRAA